MHGIIRQLRPTALDHLGLSETLRDAVSAWRARHPEISCELKMEGEVEGLGEAVNITIYRIVQECLTNVVRHAAARSVEVQVSRAQDAARGDVVRVTVRDDGKGLAQDGDRDSARYGLMGMRERVQALDGDFSIETRPGHGVTVCAVIPVMAHTMANSGAEAA